MRPNHTQNSRHVYERALDNTFVYRITYFRIGDPQLSGSLTPSSGNIDTPPVEIKTPPVEMRSIEENELDPTDGNW